MKLSLSACLTLLALSSLSTVALADGKGKVNGKKEFEEHCASCHANGGNIVNPKKTLMKADRAANGIKDAKDIIAKMRKPGPGMTAFDSKTVSNAEAKAIADYIIKTFK